MGERILNRFELHDCLGSGGFGTVYRAWDERLEREVAVKAFVGRGAGDARVLREAQAAARLNHPGIVTLYELGEDGSRTYLVSELVAGATLAARSREGSLSDREIAEIGADVCDALAHAHAHGVVHRDIKPQNVLVAEPSGRAKLMDFGIARVLGGEPLTAAGDIVGTIAYMSPEQAEGDVAGPPSDVYSLALTLYECWTGTHPVARGTPAATARAIGDEIEPLCSLRPDLPAELGQLIDRCLWIDWSARPGLEELADGLEAVAPALSREPLGPLAERRPLTGPARILHHQALPPILGGAAVGTLTLAALAAAGSLPAWGLALPLLVGCLAAFAPRLGYLAAAGGLVGWLAIVSSKPGAALIVAVLTMPQVILLPSAPRLWPLPAAAPALGVIGLAPVYAALAGLAGSLRRRVLLGVLGYGWLLVAEGAWRKTLLFGVVKPAGGDWATRSAAAFADLIAPLASRPAVLGALVWALAAACLAPLVRGRAISLELLGVLVWAAALVSAQRLLSQWDDAVAPAAGGLIAGLSVLIAGALLYRSAAPRGPELGEAGVAASPIRGDSGSLRLP
ncbi:MAG: eukaryotic-like serine/threonine-protein kinase [Solirubrobacterales bacterium]|nr:eukaryotic-like serine/threonine-protein kinase [Solirubrobacterales bacterium]